MPLRIDVTASGCRIKILHVLDEFTSESLADLGDHSIDEDVTVACLDKIASARGRCSEFVRCDNVPELVVWLATFVLTELAISPFLLASKRDGRELCRRRFFLHRMRCRLSFPPNRGEFVYGGRWCGLVRILPVGPFRLLSAAGAGCTSCGPTG